MGTNHIALLIILPLIFVAIIVAVSRYQKLQFLGDDYKDFDVSTASESINAIYNHKKTLSSKWFRWHFFMSVAWCVTLHVGFYAINHKSLKIDLPTIITILGIFILSGCFAYGVNKFMIFDDKILKYSLSKFSPDGIKALVIYIQSEKFSTKSMYKKEYFFTHTSIIFPNGTILDDPKEIPIKSIYLMNYNRNKFLRSEYQEILFFYGKGTFFLTTGSAVAYDETIEEIKKRRGSPLVLLDASTEKMQDLYLKHYGFPCKSKILHYIVKITLFKVFYVIIILLVIWFLFVRT
jgi:hypothetical protein